jgi:ADP-heptose:LPS heptosyltransferase
MQGVFTADSGPRHLANAAGTPVVFVRNLWFPSAEAGPYCDTEVDVVPPEWESLPPEQMPQYWAKIDKSSVVARVSGLLDSPARSAG